MNNERVERAGTRWRALRDLVIGDDFHGRLAAANGWTRDRAATADREYRRFLLIASVASHVVVPSPDVDKAWHEHILHTRSYAEMCGILGFTFHHDPGMTGGDAGTHADRYRRTLELYETIFRAEPPSDVWPRGVAKASLLRRIGNRIGIGEGARNNDDGGGWPLVALISTDGPTVLSKDGHYVVADHHASTVHHAATGGDHAVHSDGGGHAGGDGHSSCGGSGCGGGGD